MVVVLCSLSFNFDHKSSLEDFFSWRVMYMRSVLLLEGESGNTGQVLALQKLQGSSTTSRDVRDTALHTPLGNSGSGITTSDDRDGTLFVFNKRLLKITELMSTRRHKKNREQHLY